MVSAKAILAVIIGLIQINFFLECWRKISGISELRRPGYAEIRVNPWK